MKLTLRMQLLMFYLCVFTISFAQTKEWIYVGEVKFPQADSNYVNPYLCSMDSQDRLYVISSKVTSSYARNAIFYLDPNQTEFTKFVDFFEIGEEDSASGRVGQLIGVTAIGTDLLVSARIPNQQQPGGASSAFYFKNADPANYEVFGFNIGGSGWGTTVHGIAATKDSVIIGGIPYQGPSYRFYNFSTLRTTPGRGSYFYMSSQPMEINGPHTNGFDIIRDCAVIPNGDYNLTTTPFYTSRNALSSTSLNGGISVWEGGDYLTPAGYTSQKVIDAVGLLQFDSSIPYGITVDRKNNYLWVAGIDSLRRWVKGFSLLGSFASVADELPSANSGDTPNALGAPMKSPCDVAFSNDGETAYVIDVYGKCAYKFIYADPTGVDDNNNLNYNFELAQNFPNPFNPSTMIAYQIPQAGYVTLKVYDMLGKEVANLVGENKNEGKYTVNFNASALSSGVYIYQIRVNEFSATRKMNFIK
ncbi:MAG: T9SS type A sorting domain-containing protein [bacterium]